MRPLFLALLLLAACQKPEAQPVLARVNGEEILAGEAAGGQSLERVIDRELLAQKALEAGLERDPLVAQALDAAPRHILAQAWLERRAAGTAARALEDVAAWLRLRNAAFRPGASTQGAEQLPLTYLSRLAGMKEGEIAVFDAPAGAAVVQLVQAQDAPLSEREAAPLIGEFLSGRKRLEVAAAEVKRLRAAARIEYVGEPRAR